MNNRIALAARWSIKYKAGRKTRRRRITQANAKRQAFHAKASIYCCVLFDKTGNMDEGVQRQRLNQ